MVVAFVTVAALTEAIEVVALTEALDGSYSRRTSFTHIVSNGVLQ